MYVCMYVCRVSGDLEIRESSVVHHLHDFGKNI